MLLLILLMLFWVSMGFDIIRVKSNGNEIDFMGVLVVWCVVGRLFVVMLLCVVIICICLKLLESFCVIMFFFYVGIINL